MDGHTTEIRFAATMAAFGHAFSELRRALDQTQLDEATRYQVELVFEEIVANILRHGSPGGATLAVRVELDVRDDRVLLTFVDNGVPFDPCSHPPRVLATALEAGGLGLGLVRRAASHLDYRRTPQHTNRLVVTVPAARSRAVG